MTIAKNDESNPLNVLDNSQNRLQTSRPSIPFLLTDLHPHLSSWKSLTKSSPTSSLSYISSPVDATRFPPGITSSSLSADPKDEEGVNKAQKNFRTFCLAFHHFDEDGARRVLEDSMRSSEGIG